MLVLQLLLPLPLPLHHYVATIVGTTPRRSSTPRPCSLISRRRIDCSSRLAGSSATMGDCLGALCGAVVGGSRGPMVRQLAVMTAIAFAICGTVLRHRAYGELVRALGLLLILAVQR